VRGFFISMAFNPDLQTNLKSELAQGYNVGSIVDGRRWDGNTWTRENNSTPFSGLGGSGVNLDPVAQAQQNTSRIDTLFGSQRNEQNDYLNRFKGAISSLPTTSAIAGRIGEEIGLPKLQANAQSLNNTLYNLPTTYSKATTGFGVNANQLQRLIGQKQSELAPSAQLAAQNALNAQSTLNTRLGYEQQDQNRSLLPYQQEQALMSERFARESTGYSNAMQSELDSIIAKMNAGVQISEGEKNRAQQLAIAEAGFKNQKELQDQQIQAQRSQPVAVNDSTMIIDPSTGKVIYQPIKQTANPESLLSKNVPVSSNNQAALKYLAPSTVSSNQQKILPQAATTTSAKPSKNFVPLSTKSTLSGGGGGSWG